MSSNVDTDCHRNTKDKISTEQVESDERETHEEHPWIWIIWKGTQSNEEREEPHVFGHGHKGTIVETLGNEGEDHHGYHPADCGWNGEQVGINSAEAVGT
jgi:hypothetical protein